MPHARHSTDSLLSPSPFQATKRSGIASVANSFKENLRADDGAPYDEVIEIDLDQLRPHVNGPFTPDLAHPVGSEFASAVKVRIHDKCDVLIG